jgi:anti-anti-sigma factor
MPQLDSPAQSQDGVRPFRLTQRRIWPGCIEIEVEGELDLAVSDQLRAALDVARADACHVLIGFSACSFIDLSGLAVLVAAGRSLADRDRQLLLHGTHGQVRRLLMMTGLAKDGLLVSASDADASPFAETVPGQSFESTRPVSLDIPGVMREGRQGLATLRSVGT